MINYPCAEFDDFSFSRFGFIVWTDRQNCIQMQMITQASRVGMSNNNNTPVQVVQYNYNNSSFLVFCCRADDQKMVY